MSAKSMLLRLVVLISFWLTPVLATSVREVSLPEMLERAELVFEGEVIHVAVQETLDHRPFTRIRFRVLDVIKGSFEQSTLTLDFLGGERGASRLQVAEMDYPELGEHGIYFVETLKSRLINPLYGWSQGRFIECSARKPCPLEQGESAAPLTSPDYVVGYRHDRYTDGSA
ncbi:MAG: hypothetical protein ACK4JF_09435 [Methylohalobius sp.]